MPKDGYAVREMTRTEVDLAIDFANKEGWNPGIHDAETFYLTDPHGFFVGLWDGVPVSSISAVAYGDSFGFLGFYLVQPQFRGRGLGTEIWKRGLQHLAGRNVGLDAVLAQQKLYETPGILAVLQERAPPGNGHWAGEQFGEHKMHLRGTPGRYPGL